MGDGYGIVLVSLINRSNGATHRMHIAAEKPTVGFSLWLPDRSVANLDRVEWL